MQRNLPARQALKIRRHRTLPNLSRDDCKSRRDDSSGGNNGSITYVNIL